MSSRLASHRLDILDVPLCPDSRCGDQMQETAQSGLFECPSIHGEDFIPRMIMPDYFRLRLTPVSEDWEPLAKVTTKTASWPNPMSTLNLPPVFRHNRDGSKTQTAPGWGTFAKKS